MPIPVNDGLGIAAPRYLDLRCGKIVAGKSVPYDTTAEALAAIPESRRAEGLVILVKTGLLITEHQFVGGVADVNLVLKKDEPKTEPFTSILPFNRQLTIMSHDVDGPVSFTKNNIGAVAGFGCFVSLIADGINAPTYTGIKISSNSSNYSNINGTKNCIFFFYDGVDVWANIWQEKVESGLPIPLTLGTATGITFASNIYTSTAATWNDSHAVMAQKITADGYVQLNIHGGIEENMLGFNTTNADEAFTNYEYFVWTSTAGALNVGADGVVIGPLGFRTLVNGDLLRLQRTGSVVKAQVSSDSGTTWEDAHTFSTASTGDLFINISLNVTGTTIEGLVGYGVV